MEGVHPDDMCFNIFAYWDSRRHCVMYVELWGHPFGLSSAVLTYNRDPELHVAIMRTLLFSPCTQFYDDHLSLGLSCAGVSGQRSYHDLCRLTGKVLDAEKHEPVASEVVYTGCALDLQHMFGGLFCAGT